MDSHKTALSRALRGLAGSSLLAVAPAAFTAEHAQNSALEEVIVSAQKQDESVQTVPLAISALDEKSLERMNYTNLSGLSNKVPALNISHYVSNSSQLTLFIRGVGLIASNQSSRDPGVGVYLDDVYLGRAQGLSGDLADVERIEVLRGPQGTLYGRNTIGGAVKFVTTRPTGEFGLKETITVGNLDTFRSVTNLNVPRMGIVSAKLTYVGDTTGGRVHNPGEGPDFGEADKSGYRLALLIEPSADFTIDYAFDHSRQSGTSSYIQQVSPSPFYPAGTYTTPISKDRRDTAIRGSDLPLKDDFSLGGHALTMTWELSPDVTAKSISAYRSLDTSALTDAVDGYGFPAEYRDKLNQHQYSQEFFLNGSHDRFDWIGGLYYFLEKAHQESAILTGFGAFVRNINDPYDVFRPVTIADLPPATISTVKNESEALYGHLTYTPPVLDDDLRLEFGGRWSHDLRVAERERNNLFVDSGRKSYSHFDYSVTVDYQWNPSVHTYAKVSTAYRAGGFSISSTGGEPFDPEKLKAYELGLKSMWFDDRVRFNVALYESKYTDIQTDFVDASLKSHTINAGSTTIKGAEVELAVVPFEGLELRADLAHMIAPVSKLDNPYTGKPFTDNVALMSPKNKINLDAEYRFAATAIGEWSTDVGYSWTSEYYTAAGQNGNFFPIPSYGLIDARVTLSSIPIASDQRTDLSISVWGKNLADKEYYSYSLLGGAIFGDPRTFGITATLKY